MTAPIGYNPAIKFWGVISSAAAAHATTADLWSAIRDAAEAQGLPSPGVNAAQVGALRAYATSIANTAQAISAASDDLSIANFRIPNAPYSRSQVEQNAAPLFQVTFTMTSVGPDGESTDYRTILTQALPGTVGDLADLIADAAAGMAADYGVGLVSTDFISVVAR